METDEHPDTISFEESKHIIEADTPDHDRDNALALAFADRMETRYHVSVHEGWDVLAQPYDDPDPRLAAGEWATCLFGRQAHPLGRPFVIYQNSLYTFLMDLLWLMRDSSSSVASIGAVAGTKKTSSINMDSSGVVNLSRRLLVTQTGQSADTLPGLVPIFVVPPVFESLRVSLSKTVGIVEFQALFSRALSLAKQETPWLEAVRVNQDASLGGLVEAGRLQTKDAAARGCAVLLSHFLELLMNIVGEDLTLLLVRDALTDTPAI